MLQRVQKWASADPWPRLRVELAHRCLALGFKGSDEAAAARLKNEMVQKLKLEAPGHEEKLLPDSAYDADPRQLYRRPTRWIPWIAVGFVIVAVASTVFFMSKYQDSTRELRQFYERYGNLK